MPYRKEFSLDDIVRELPALRERMGKVVPAYVTSLERLSAVPLEFERRCATQWIDALLDRVRQDYQDTLSRCQAVGAFGDVMVRTMAAMTQQPAEMSLRESVSSWLCIGIWPSGQIKPVLREDSLRQAGVTVIRLPEFEQAVLRLKGEVLSGKVVPKSADEIPRFIH